MNRFDISLGKKPPPPDPAESFKFEPNSKLVKDFISLNGKITIIDENGNQIEGFVESMNVNMERPVSQINTFSGPVGFLPGRATTRIGLEILVDRLTRIQQHD